MVRGSGVHLQAPNKLSWRWALVGEHSMAKLPPSSLQAASRQPPSILQAASEHPPGRGSRRAASRRLSSCLHA
eukprot:11173615-Lingulodinium_polyedra.AAC.1